MKNQLGHLPQELPFIVSPVQLFTLCYTYVPSMPCAQNNVYHTELITQLRLQLDYLNLEVKNWVIFIFTYGYFVWILLSAWADCFEELFILPVGLAVDPSHLFQPTSPWLESWNRLLFVPLFHSRPFNLVSVLVPGVPSWTWLFRLHFFWTFQCMILPIWHVHPFLQLNEIQP